MKPFETFPDDRKSRIRHVLTDIDDTLTIHGRLPATVFIAMEKLSDVGISVIPITGRPAGWCDHIARMWPVDAIVGENGAFYFRYDEKKKKMIRRWRKSQTQREADRKRLDRIASEILTRVEGCGLSADQPYREADLAIDFCEDVPTLPPEKIREIVDIFAKAGAEAKVSSIHVNGWFGKYDKLTMTVMLFKEMFDIDLEQEKNGIIYTGDSPNDSPMFSYFPNSVGVANVQAFEGRMPAEPKWITSKEGGAGFSEMVDTLLGVPGGTAPHKH